MSSEFDLIRNYFTRATRQTRLGIGDDCALIQLSSGMELAVSADMLVSGTHFFPDVNPFQLGHKVLAVNLSDMAAMGAVPRWCTLAVALPDADESWIDAFSRGFFQLADQYSVDLIGGDTTRGPLNFCVQIMGEVPAGAAIKRSGANAGDDIWVSGQLGDAALALAHINRKHQLSDAALSLTMARLNTPIPRVELGNALRGVATSCIDISDGLLADLGHILDQSVKGAEVWLSSLPRSTAVKHCSDKPLADACLLSGGDDYELCFTGHPNNRSVIELIAENVGVPLTRIGTINEHRGLVVFDENHNPINISKTGFDHFR